MLAVEVAPPAAPPFPSAPPPAPPFPGLPFPLVAGFDSPPPLGPPPPSEPLLPFEWLLFPQAGARPTESNRANESSWPLPGALELVHIWSLPKVVPSWRGRVAAGHPGPIAPYSIDTRVLWEGKARILLFHTNRTYPHPEGAAGSL